MILAIVFAIFVWKKSDFSLKYNKKLLEFIDKTKKHNSRPKITKI